MSFLISPISFASADTGVSNIISYQGHLTDTGGNPLGGGGTSYYFKFSFWDSPVVSSGNKVWPSSSPNSTSLIVKQGLFSVNIGDVSNGYPDTLDYDWNSNKNVYLQIEISSDNINFETLSPRSLITSAPTSQVSSQVNGINPSSFGTTTPFLNSLISALSTSVNSAVMTIKGMVGQVANLFNINDSSGNSLFTVTADGKVGVGTASPGNNLDVVKTENIFAQNQVRTPFGLTLFDSPGTSMYAGTGVGISFTLKSDTLTNNVAAIYGTRDTNDSSGQLNFYTANSGSLSQKMVIDRVGNVGIGTTIPSAKLDILDSTLAGSGSLAGSALKIKQTWNTTGNPTAIKLDVTNTASDASSLLMDLQVGGVSRFSVDNGGTLTLHNSIGNSGTLSISNSTLLYSAGGNTISFNAGNNRLTIKDGGSIGWDQGDNNHTIDTGFSRLSNAVIAIGNGVPGNVSGTLIASNIGIGTTTPSAKLELYGTAGSSADLFAVSSSTGSRLFTVAANGNVGAGTTNPLVRLQISGGNIGLDSGQVIGFNTFYGMDPNWRMGRSTNGITKSLVTGNSFDLIMGANTTEGLTIGRSGTSSSFEINTTTLQAYFRGDVGVGTTSPANKLSVSGSMNISGGLAIGDTSVVAGKLFMRQSGADNSSGFVLFNSAGLNSARWYIDANGVQRLDNGNTGQGNISLNGGGSGNVGIGTTTPSAQLTTTGTIRFASLGMGSLQTDTDGNLTVSSDEKLKNIQGNFTRGLSDLIKINPISYKWNTISGYDTDSTYSGFSAQNIQLAIPEAVATSSNGFLTLSDRPILATVINAVKEIGNKIERILAWFGSDGSKFNVAGDVCVDNVCVTKDQFKAILQNAGGIVNTQTPASVLTEVKNSNTNIMESTSTGTTSNNTGTIIDNPTTDVDTGPDTIQELDTTVIGQSPSTSNETEPIVLPINNELPVVSESSE